MIGKDSERIQVVLSKKEAKKIQEMAEKEDRSISNMTLQIIRKQLKKKKYSIRTETSYEIS